MILVTGATGLVGTHLLVRLIQEKKLIRALYRSEKKKIHAQKVISSFFEKESLQAVDTIQWAKGNINDIPTLTEAFEGITYVYHCAAKISFDPSHYRELRKINIEGTANIVNLCLIFGIKKLCHVSSIATLGKHPVAIDEDTEWNPEIVNSVYAITKYGAEMEVWRGVQEGLDTVVVNPGVIIGSGFFDAGSGYLFKMIHSGMKYYTTGITGYVAVDDVINIMYCLMEGSYINQRYILVGENLSYQDIFTKIAKALNKPIPKKEATLFTMYLVYYAQSIGRFLGIKQSIFRSSLRSVFTTSYYKNNKIKKELNYTFIPIDKSIKETAEYFLHSKSN